jgi:hypothetical protein
MEYVNYGIFVLISQFNLWFMSFGPSSSLSHLHVNSVTSSCHSYVGHAIHATKGVLMQMSCPYTSPQNGKAEHILYTINNMLRSLLFHASIPARYWVEGLHTTTYLLNHLPTKAITTTSPYFALMESPPPMSTCTCSDVPAILISPPKPPTN